ncbi:MAG: lipoyl protein ligase domain-containing protein [Ilumatobacteraceae bacterium]
MEAVPLDRLVRGSAGELHARPIVAAAVVEQLEITRPAVVIGSTQSFDVVNAPVARELGFDVVRRRSGGGVVVLRPRDHVWIDVTVPRGHREWCDDVERASWWLGDAWCKVLRDVVGGGPVDGGWRVWRDKLVATAPERRVCFASVGPGEVVQANRKVVGISQRRTKDAARFQCTVFGTIDVSLYESLLRNVVPKRLNDAAGVGDALDAVASAALTHFAELLG